MDEKIGETINIRYADDVLQDLSLIASNVLDNLTDGIFGESPKDMAKETELIPSPSVSSICKRVTKLKRQLIDIEQLVMRIHANDLTPPSPQYRG